MRLGQGAHAARRRRRGSPPTGGVPRGAGLAERPSRYPALPHTDSVESEARPEGDAPPLGRAVRAFPIVGALIGLIAGLVYGIAVGIGLPDIVAAVLAIGAGALITGALHEDGLADMADGFGGGSTRERKLAIMRDSRIGAYGVIALVVVLAAKVGAIADLEGTGLVIAAMVAAAGVSRAAMPAVMLWLEPARADGLAADAGRPPSTHVWTGLALAAVLAVGLLTWSGLVAFLIAGIGTAAVAWLAERQVGGHTGDVLGGVQQLSEVLFLLTLAAVR